MKIMVCANVLGNFRELKKDADSCKAEYICIAGNIGISKDGEFREFLNGGINITQKIIGVTGKYEDFSMAPNQVGKIELLYHMSNRTDTPFLYSGLSGSYSPVLYEKDHGSRRYMSKKNLFSIPENRDIVLLHNVPGKLGKSNSLDFDDDLFNFISEKSPRYLFIGGYDRFSAFKFLDTTVLFLTSLKKGYALVETEDWSCLFQHKMP